ncbi:tubulin polyglutamylase complex subunit 2-like isoform X2 [Portunus trituberculatus]|uniref:tubulin polyglutamylase complex subunit 2-like isoform X2 n=1 Tax=Portunus trituberculatus TaxID=210409 RepID=UPI001E1CEDE0|nr:tubulin polyglutamylase complex subunit 2-like isoform X2 [Portunus trituberculatus]
MDGRKERDTNFITDLTLGLVETLQGVAGVQDVSVASRGGVERAVVLAWEQRHNVVMPGALRSLYMATDGFKLTWNYSTAGKVLPLGNMEVHPLGRVNRLGTGRGSGDPLAPSITDLALAEDPPLSMGPNPLPRPGPKLSSASTAPSPPTFHTSKMFEIDSCQGFGRVVVAFPGRGENFPEGSYWFVDLSLRPHLLAADTHTYWRLMLAHLGMPQWQALVAGQGLTPWARWYEVVAAYLLEGARPPRPAHQAQDHVNRLDWSVFKTKKTHHKTKSSKDTSKDSIKDAAAKDTGKPKE